MAYTIPQMPVLVYVWQADKTPFVDPPDWEVQGNLALGRSQRTLTADDSGDDNRLCLRSLLLEWDAIGDVPWSRERNGDDRYVVNLPGHPWYHSDLYYIQAAEIVALGFENQHAIWWISLLDQVE